MEATYIRGLYPEKIPLIVEKYEKEKTLPHLNKVKFLVPHEMSLGQFITVIRSRLKLEPSQTVYLAIAGKNILNLSLTMIEIHSKYKDEDGFLYVSYASEEMFG